MFYSVDLDEFRNNSCSFNCDRLNKTNFHLNTNNWISLKQDLEKLFVKFNFKIIIFVLFSGIGRELGPEGIHEYLESKTITIAVPQKNS
jgi:hypothetical protein